MSNFEKAIAALTSFRCYRDWIKRKRKRLTKESDAGWNRMYKKMAEVDERIERRQKQMHIRSRIWNERRKAERRKNWAKRGLTEEQAKWIHHRKIGAALEARAAKMTPEERRAMASQAFERRKQDRRKS